MPHGRCSPIDRLPRRGAGCPRKPPRLAASAFRAGRLPSGRRSASRNGGRFQAGSDIDTVRSGPTPAADPEAPAAAGPPTRDELTSAWSEAVLPRLGGLTKAMYAAGHFLDSTGPKALFTVPNAVHREKAGQKLPEVEAALAAHFGRPVLLELVVDDGAGSAGSTTAVGGAGQLAADSAAADRDQDDDIGDIAELEDAPADDRSAAQRVIETFPGAEIVDT